MNIWKVYDNAIENGDNNDNNDNDDGHRTNFDIYWKTDPVTNLCAFLPLMFSSCVQILLQTYEFVLIGILFPDIAISKKKIPSSSSSSSSSSMTDTNNGSVYKNEPTEQL